MSISCAGTNHSKFSILRALAACAALAMSVGPASAAKTPAGVTPAPVKGFADLHLHQMSHLAFGGRYIFGSHEGAIDKALPACSGHSLDGHGFGGGTEGGLGNLLPHEKSGAASKFSGWPRWNTTSHQQAHADWLHRAHQEGLSLIVMSAVHQSDFCEILPDAMKLKGAKCDDFSNIKRQIDAARAFEKSHDWYRIAYSPAEARKLIAAGKLAVVLALETSNAFGSAVEARLDEYEAMGVRSYQPVHELDNKMGGAAWHAMPLRALQTLHNLDHLGSRALSFAKDLFDAATHATSAKTFFAGVGDAFSQLGNRIFGMELDKNRHNLRGLTELGKTLLRSLFKRKLLVDVSHLSQKGIADALTLSAENGHYPLYSSHTHVKEVMTPEEGAIEWAYPSEMLVKLARTGGVIGLRSAPGDMRHYKKAAVVNDCPGSTKSFAQVVEYTTKELGLDVALASDFNGWATNSVPRFGKEACIGAGGSKAQLEKWRKKQAKPSGSSLDHRGFGHVGLEGALVRELKGFGVDTSSIERSAETFLRMWERAQDDGRPALTKKVDVAAALSTLEPYVAPPPGESAVKTVLSEVWGAVKSAASDAGAYLLGKAKKALHKK